MPFRQMSVKLNKKYYFCKLFAVYKIKYETAKNYEINYQQGECFPG